MSKWREEQIGSCRIICADYRDVVAELPPVDMLFTSPPYAQQRDYHNPIDDWTALMSVIKNVSAKDDTQILVNLGLVRRDNQVQEYWHEWIDDMCKAGWRYFDMLVWDQGAGLPGGWHGRMAPSYELVFQFNKNKRVINKWTRAVGVKSGGRPVKGMLREKDGTRSDKVNSPDKIGQAYKLPDNVVRVNRERGAGAKNSPASRMQWHPAVFPIEFPAYFIRSYTKENEIVFDPFLGSGTTAAACIELDRQFIGCELSEEYFEKACEWLRRHQKKPNLFKPEAYRPPSLIDVNQ